MFSTTRSLKLGSTMKTVTLGMYLFRAKSHRFRSKIFVLIFFCLYCILIMQSERISFHSAPKLQGSAGAEHPNSDAGPVPARPETECPPASRNETSSSVVFFVKCCGKFVTYHVKLSLKCVFLSLKCGRFAPQPLVQGATRLKSLSVITSRI